MRLPSRLLLRARPCFTCDGRARRGTYEARNEELPPSCLRFAASTPTSAMSYESVSFDSIPIRAASNTERETHSLTVVSANPLSQVGPVIASDE